MRELRGQPGLVPADRLLTSHPVSFQPGQRFGVSAGPLLAVAFQLRADEAHPVLVRGQQLERGPAAQTDLADLLRVLPDLPAGLSLCPCIRAGDERPQPLLALVPPDQDDVFEDVGRRELRDLRGAPAVGAGEGVVVPEVPAGADDWLKPRIFITCAAAPRQEFFSIASSAATSLTSSAFARIASMSAAVSSSGSLPCTLPRAISSSRSSYDPYSSSTSGCRPFRSSSATA